MSLPPRALLSAVPAALACAAAALPAQPPAAGVVRVQVTDSAGAPIADASVALVRGVNEVVVAGTTDAAGRRTLAAPMPPGAVQLVVRRIGHQRADRFLAWTGRDTLSVAVTLLPTAQTLSAVTKLRPDMVYGVGGAYAGCGPTRSLWVNGVRQRLVAVDPAVAAEMRLGRLAQRATPHLRPSGRRAIPVDVQTFLRSIRPEHVAEVKATDCRELALQRARTESAIFVVPKPGVAFHPGVGSFVVDADSALARVVLAGAGAVPDDGIVAPPPGARPPMSVAVTSAPPAGPAVERLPAYRLRVLGVYDEETGTPVAGMDVVDVQTGTRTRTTETGTAVLALLPDGGGTVRLVRAGYRTREVPVVISPADTLPLTLLLAKAK